MNAKLTGIFGLIYVMIGLALFFVPSHLAPVCPVPKMESSQMEGMKKDGMEEKPQGSSEMKPEMKKPMKCFHTGNAIKGVGIITVLLGIIFSILNNKDIRTGISIGNIGIALLPVWFIHAIGVCGNPSMRCRTLTVPAVYLIVAVFIVINAIFIIRNRK